MTVVQKSSLVVYSTVVTLTCISDTYLHGYTLGVTIWTACFRNLKIPISFIPSWFFSFLIFPHFLFFNLREIDCLPMFWLVYQHLPGLFLFPSQSISHFWPYGLFSHLYHSSLSIPPPTKTPISTSVIQSVLSTTRSKQLGPAGESQPSEKSDSTRNSWFSTSAEPSAHQKFFLFILVTTLSILICLLLI